MRCNDAEMEALEWGGLLHDVGKIGVPDDVLLKPDRLTKRRAHDHEQPPGARRPDHRAGHASSRPSCRSFAITTSGTTARATRTGSSATRSRKLARILHVADAFEAMTAERPVPHDAADARAGARRAAQVRRHPVRPERRRRLRRGPSGSKASATQAAASRRPAARSACWRAAARAARPIGARRDRRPRRRRSRLTRASAVLTGDRPC